MVGYMNRRGMEVIGYYRIAAGIVVIGLILGGMLSAA